MFDKLSIRYKLLVLLGLSLGVGLCVSAAVALYATFAAERQSSLRALHQIAAITGENMRAALAFHDKQSAAKIFEPLHTNPHIRYAFVESDTGELFGQYQAQSMSAAEFARWREVLQHAHLPTVAEQEDVQQGMQLEHHYVIYPIDFEGRRIGRLALLADNQGMYTKMHQYVVLQVSAAVVIFLSLLLLSWRLHLIFTRPIFDLIAGMRRIGSTKDYTTVLDTHHKDEFGELYQGFNAMLLEVRLRDEKLNLLATTDTLTGLANRRHALESMHAMALRAQRDGTQFGVIMLDVDHFKKVNDTYGHPMGDRVLREVARIVQMSVRSYDVAARFGGEEFLVLCDSADLATTMEVAERIRCAVARHAFERGEGQAPLQVTVSLGVCACTTTPQTMMQLIERADQALYRAKQEGRNRAESAQGVY